MVKSNWDTEELIANWTLLPQELELTKKKVGGNQIGFALLLKHFGAWSQNLITQYHLRYGGRGVMIYWHVENVGDECYRDRV